MQNQEFVESRAPRRRGLPPFSWYAAIPLLAITGLVVWQLWRLSQWIGDHFGAFWSKHGVFVLIVGGVLLFLFVLLPQLWRGWVTLAHHRQKMADLDAHRSLIMASSRAMELAAQRGHNIEMTSGLGHVVRVINPASVTPASKTANNYYGVPQLEAGEIEDAGEEEEELPPLPMIRLIDLINDGEVLPDEEESIIGYERDGTPTFGKLFAVEGNIYNSIFTVGDQGYGKSTFAVLIAAYTIYHGGRLLVIDPELGTEQSLTARLGPLANPAFLLCDVASTPEETDALLDIAEAEIDQPGEYPVCLLVDELSMIARHAEKGMGKWKDVGKRVLSVAEDYSTRGRKRRRRTVAMGQFVQGKRNGGTTLLYSMAKAVFRTDKKQAKWALEPEDAAIAPTLIPGEVIVIPSRSDEPRVQMQLVYPDPEGLQVIADAMLDLRKIHQHPFLYAVNGQPPSVRDVRPDEEWEEWGESARTRKLEEEEETDDDGDDGYAHKMAVDQPVERAHTTYNERTYPCMNDLQMELFVTAYNLTRNMDNSLKQAGANTRYRDHARQIIIDRKLKKEGK